MYYHHRFPSRAKPWKPVVKPYVAGAVFYTAWMALVIYGLTTI
jgi:uncharacterized protein (DUF2062 family)